MVPVVAKKSGQFTQGRVYVVGNVKDQTEPKTIEVCFWYSTIALECYLIVELHTLLYPHLLHQHLRMDWLTYYQVTIDCGKRRIIINTHKEET
ncbi:unnamed protein product [Prunus armeniaca]